MHCISYLAYSKSHNLLFMIPLVYKYCYLYKVRTLKTLIVPNEKAPEGAISVNGAGKGVLLEHLSKFFNVVKTEEYQEVEYKLQKLVA